MLANAQFRAAGVSNSTAIPSTEGVPFSKRGREDPEVGLGRNRGRVSRETSLHDPRRPFRKHGRFLAIPAGCERNPELPHFAGRSGPEQPRSRPSGAPLAPKGMMGFLNQFFGSSTSSARPGVATPPFFQTGPPALRSANMATTIGGDIAGVAGARSGGTASGILGAGKSILGLIGTILARSGAPALPMPASFGSGVPMVNLVSLRWRRRR